jgi:hypothetical protein
MADDDDMPDDEMPEDELDEPMQGETVPAPAEEDDGVEDTDDGGAIVTLDEEESEQAKSPDFYKNLAEEMAESDLDKLASQFLELVDRDREARKKRDEQYEEGLRRTGLGNDAPGGAQFQGASKVVHPMMTEACIDFAARAMKELMPAGGPAKDFIPGELTMARVKKAHRKTAFMNWQLTVQAPEFRAEIEQLLTQVPLGGAQYLKMSWDEHRNRPGFLFTAIDDMYLPFAATNFYSAQRRTHVQYLTQLDYKQRVRSGMYRDVDVVPASADPDFSEAAKANDKIEGRSETSYNEDGLRTVYEIYAIASLEGQDADEDVDVEPAPYILTVDKLSRKVLSIYRNWDELDETKEELQWFVEFPFVPWRGAYPIGLPHMIGGISAAATGALRALLDSAHISNSQTMLKLKGGTRGGQTLEIQPTQVLEIEGGLNVDDVRKLAMPLPYNPPSGVLLQLLGVLVDAGKGVVRTTLDDMAEQNANTPVGTTLARVEQGMVVFSAIHGRLHDAMGRVLRILHRLNGMYLDDEDVEAEIGEELATRKDFEGPLDVVPVSDPNIFSEAQRYAQIQAIAQRAAAVPQLYNARKVEERILDTMKVPNAKDLLAPALEPQAQNAVNENVKATMGKPIVAFPEQDHIAHLKTHLSYMMNPALGMNPLIAPAYIPAMLGHIKEHIAWWYAVSVFDVGTETTGEDLGDMMKENKTPEDRRAFDRMLAEASHLVSDRATGVFQSLPPAIQKAQQFMQQFAPQPQPDAATQAAMADIQARQQIAGQKAQLDGQKAQAQAQADQAQLQLDQQDLQLKGAALQQKAQEAAARQAAEDRRAQAEMAARQQMNTQDNQTAMQIANLEVVSGEDIAVSTGTGINP